MDLTQAYPCLSKNELEDFQSLEATEDQLQRANDRAKIEIDKRLNDYILKKRSHSTEGVIPQRVAVIGSIGSGKSATGNTLLQRKWFNESVKATTETKVVIEENSQKHPQLSVVDTPGSWEIPKGVQDISLYIFVINLASPRFGWNDLKKIRKLKDYVNIVRSGCCILLLTHANDALSGKSLIEYVRQIQGDPLYHLIVEDMESWRVMAINNSEKTSYEEELQHKMIINLLRNVEKKPSSEDNPGCCCSCS